MPPRPPSPAPSGRPARSARPPGGSSCRTTSTTRSARSCSPASQPPRSATPRIRQRRSVLLSRPGHSMRSSPRSNGAKPRAARSPPVDPLADDEAYLIAPTVFENVADDAFLSCEEVFGPVTSLYRFSTLDEALERANAVEFGLSAAIFTRRPARDAALRERAPGRHPPRQLTDCRCRRPRAVRRSQGLRLGATRAGPRGDGVLHRDRHGLPGCASCLSAFSSRGRSAVSAPGSPGACSTTGTQSSATTSARTVAGSSSCSATTRTRSHWSRATSPISPRSNARSTSTRSPGSSTSLRCRCRSFAPTLRSGCTSTWRAR